MIRYPVGGSGEVVSLADGVLDHFARHRQTRFWHSEAGGLLFARLGAGVVNIEAVTGPRRSDRRSRYSYAGDRTSEQGEIDVHHAAGLHYVGDWHTHPEDRPSPSGRDLLTMASRVTESRHLLTGFLFVIVGRAPAPDGLAVLVHDGVAAHRLAPAVNG